MSTITRELAKLFRKITNSEIDAEGNAHVVLSPADSLLINNARIALASLEAESAGWQVKRPGGNWVSIKNEDVDHYKFNEELPVREVYTAPPAPVVSLTDEQIDEVLDSRGNILYVIADKRERLRMFAREVLRAATHQSALVSVPETLPCPVMLEPGLRFGKGVRTQTMLDALQRRAEYYVELEAMTPEQRADYDAGMKEFAAMLQGTNGNSPVIPDGYVLVPIDPTEAMLDEFDSIIDYGAEDSKDAWARLIAAAPQQEVK